MKKPKEELRELLGEMLNEPPFVPVERNGTFMFHDIQGRGEEWKKMRLGIPTASNFYRILTPKTMQLSASADAYMDELLAEWVTGTEIEGAEFETQWMRRGTEMEDQAIAAYEGITDTETSNGGLFLLKSGLAACSPDRLVGKDGGVENKCRLLHVQIGNVRRGTTEDKAKVQIQGCLWITEREWWDAWSYHPRLMVPPKRVYRDEVFIKKLEDVMNRFTDTMLEERFRLEREYGPFIREELSSVVNEPPSDIMGITPKEADSYIESMFPKDIEYKAEASFQPVLGKQP